MTRISIEGTPCSGKLTYLKILEQMGFYVHYGPPDPAPDQMVHIYEHRSNPDQPTWMPDVIIYLYCNPIVCCQRLDELKNLHIRYEFACDELNCPPTTKIYKINAQEDCQSVVNNLTQILRQLAV